MAQTIDMPVRAFEEMEKAANLLRAHQVGDRVIATEVFTGPRAREVHGAMDARLKDLEAAGAKLVHRTAIGRNSPCPCGSGVKFKKCCIGKAVLAG